MPIIPPTHDRTPRRRPIALSDELRLDVLGRTVFAVTAARRLPAIRAELDGIARSKSDDVLDRIDATLAEATR
jgi:hypothetical protein